MVRGVGKRRAPFPWEGRALRGLSGATRSYPWGLLRPPRQREGEPAVGGGDPAKKPESRRAEHALDRRARELAADLGPHPFVLREAEGAPEGPRIKWRWRELNSRPKESSGGIYRLISQ